MTNLTSKTVRYDRVFVNNRVRYNQVSLYRSKFFEFIMPDFNKILNEGSFNFALSKAKTFYKLKTEVRKIGKLFGTGVTCTTSSRQLTRRC